MKGDRFTVLQNTKKYVSKYYVWLYKVPVGPCRKAIIPSLSSVEIWSPYMANLADATTEESIYQYSEELLSIPCSCNITREKIPTLTNKTRIQFDIQGCVKTKWQVVDLLGNTSHQTLLISYQAEIIINRVLNLKPTFSKDTKFLEGLCATIKLWQTLTSAIWNFFPTL